jgi:crotonobetainyl-CoA:carnitine CoA-transferase CaiB-like acyl-CoA transferase
VWVAVSTSAESVAHRVLQLMGLGDDPRFASFEGRAAHREELDASVAAWIGARTSTEVLDAFDRAEAAIARVYSMHDVLADPHVREREMLIEVDGVVQQAPLARLSRTPAHVRHVGRSLGADTEAVLRELDEHTRRTRR